MFDISLMGAILAGLLSFLTPCILPIVPFYLSYMAGVGMEQIQQADEIDRRTKRRAVIGAMFFSAGVITVFMALGASAFALGQIVREWFDVLRWVAAAIIILMGLHFLGILKIPLLYREARIEAGSTKDVSFLGSYIIGLAFAFGWTPCVGPALAAILMMAGGADSAWRGISLLLGFGIGMTFPFVLAAMFVGPFLNWMRKFRRHLGLMEKIMGAFLVLFGVLIATNKVSVIAQWMLEIGPDLGLLK